MSTTPLIAVAGATWLVLSAVAPAAHAYRTAADLEAFSGTERVRWSASQIRIVRGLGAPPGITDAQARAAFERALSAWSEPSCSGFSFVDDGVALGPAAPGDGTNTIEWLDAGWQKLGAPPSAAAFTDVQYERGEDGEWQIIEADLYLNAQDHEWALEVSGESDARDLQSVVTHEAGHMLGLLHPCELSGEDDAPDCAEMPNAAQTAMFPAYSPGQRSLGADDRAGVCHLYPVGTQQADAAGVAISPARLGADCSEADDCLDRQCLAGLSERPMCTKLCQASIDCPHDWECSAVDERDVCVPLARLEPAGGTSCRMTPAAPGVPRGALLISLATGLTALWRRRTRALGER
jgi:hypothetical protein